jgi:hypothetical protein
MATDADGTESILPTRSAAPGVEYAQPPRLLGAPVAGENRNRNDSDVVLGGTWRMRVETQHGQRIPEEASR